MKTILSCILLLLISSIAQAEPEFKIIPLQHRFASDLLIVIEPMVGANGTVTGYNDQLILRAEPQRMREIEATIERLDTARVNRRITVNASNNTQSKRNTTEATGRINIGNVSIGNHRRSRTNTGNINIEPNIEATIERKQTKRNRNSSQFLNVLDGERAFIRVGKSIPFSEEWITITRHYVQVDRTTGWRDISTGFAVRPQTIGNQVELQITPRIASLNSQGYIDFETLSTTLRVSLGEWVDIAGAMSQQDEVSRRILGHQSGAFSQQNSLNIRVD